MESVKNYEFTKVNTATLYDERTVLSFIVLTSHTFLKYLTSRILMNQTIFMIFSKLLINFQELIKVTKFGYS